MIGGDSLVEDLYISEINRKRKVKLGYDFI